MSKTIYKVVSHKAEIIPVECVKETPAFVTIRRERFYQKGKFDESRTAKRSGYDNYFDTWQEAKDFLLERAIRSVESCKKSYESSQEFLKKVNFLVDR